MITQIIFMQDGKVHFHKTIADLLESTNEQKISKAIAKILKSQSNE
jgi:Cu-processing system ATP-binding protein